MGYTGRCRNGFNVQGYLDLAMDVEAIITQLISTPINPAINTPLYILCGETLMECTGRCRNGCNKSSGAVSASARACGLGSGPARSPSGGRSGSQPHARPSPLAWQVWCGAVGGVNVVWCRGR
jgi:hypothetical protein